MRSGDSMRIRDGLVWGGLLFLSACGGDRPAAGVSGKPAVGWVHDFTEAKTAARTAGKPIFADFYSDT